MIFFLNKHTVFYCNKLNLSQNNINLKRYSRLEFLNKGCKVRKTQKSKQKSGQENQKDKPKQSKTKELTKKKHTKKTKQNERKKTEKKEK